MNEVYLTFQNDGLIIHVIIFNAKNIQGYVVVKTCTLKSFAAEKGKSIH